jgi:hypothetical protein
MGDRPGVEIMKKSRILHLKTLQEHGACTDQVKLFRKRFGESVRVTEALCVKVAEDFDFDWAAQHLLTPTKAWAEYKRVEAPAWAEYDRVMAPAWAEYERVEALAWAEYKRVRARAFARGYLS